MVFFFLRIREPTPKTVMRGIARRENTIRGCRKPTERSGIERTILFYITIFYDCLTPGLDFPDAIQVQHNVLVLDSVIDD